MHIALLLLVPLALEEPLDDLRGLEELDAVETPALFGLGPLDELVPMNVTEEDGVTFTRYRQTHAGIDTEGALVVKSREGVIERVSSRLVVGLALDTKPAIDAREAAEIAASLWA